MILALKFRATLSLLTSKKRLKITCQWLILIKIHSHSKISVQWKGTKIYDRYQLVYLISVVKYVAVLVKTNNIWFLFYPKTELSHVFFFNPVLPTQCLDVYTEEHKTIMALERTW